MRANTLVAVAVTAVVLYVILRSRAAGAAVRTVASVSDVDWIPDPEADAAWWAVHSGGTPSTAGSRGTGTTTPATKIIDRISSVFRGDYATWSSPNANTNQQQQLSFSPAGASIPPGPFPPEQPTPQGPTEPTSPWLPPNLLLKTPVAASPWSMDLSMADPFALIAYKGGWIDVERVGSLN